MLSHGGNSIGGEGMGRESRLEEVFGPWMVEVFEQACLFVLGDVVPGREGGN